MRGYECEKAVIETFCAWRSGGLSLPCEAGNGPARVVFPLLALMRNQIAATEPMGVRAATINADNQDDWTEVETKLVREEIDILLIWPE